MVKLGMMHTNTNIEIQKFSKEHIKDILKIEQLCFSVPWGENELCEELNNQCAKFYVAIKEKKVVGYVGLYVVCNEGDVARVAVLPEYRRYGIAKALLEKSFKDELNSVFLDVRESNVPAKELYKSLGFEEIGIRKNYYSNPAENAVLMKKEFN